MLHDEVVDILWNIGNVASTDGRGRLFDGAGVTFRFLHVSDSDDGLLKDGVKVRPDEVQPFVFARLDGARRSFLFFMPKEDTARQLNNRAHETTNTKRSGSYGDML